MSANNLDRMAAACAHDITANAVTKAEKKKAEEQAKKLENMAFKALGVLQENGVYACMLSLYSKKDDEAKPIRRELLASLGKVELRALNLKFPEGNNSENWLEVGKHLNEKVCAHLDTLLMIKQLWEQTLIYTRHSAKARGAQP